MKGTMVRETSIDANTDVITANGRLRMNSPEPSGRNTKGRNAIISVAVQPTTASVICLVASMAAYVLECPSRSHRSIFSTTTILSSTSNPKATTKPTILNWFNEKPRKFSATIPRPSDKGMATITTIEARPPRGSSVIITRPMAMRKSIARPVSRLSTLSA